MTTAEKLAKLKAQLDLARAMVTASDPKAAEFEHREVTALMLRVTGDMGLGHYDEAASSARELYQAVLKLQAAWAKGESSATGRALTQVETLAAEIEADLRRKAAGR
jgi:hypothetical protein